MENLKDVALALAAKVSKATITQRQKGDVMILDAEGNIVIGENVDTIRKMIHCLLAEGHRKILLNLAEVRWMDSKGIGELVSSLVAVNRAGGQIKLLNVRANIREVLRATKVLSIFNVYDDEEFDQQIWKNRRLSK